MVNQQVGLYITFWAKEGKIEELVSAVTAMLPVAAEEEGTLVYGMHRVKGNLEGISVYEIYRDAEAQQKHSGSSALAHLKSALPDLLGAPPEAYPLAPIANGKGLPF